MACRWGILGTANIANKNIPAIRRLSREVAEVVAVASRTLERAQEFAKKHDISKAYGTYEELLNDPEIDAVYIPLPTAMHCEWVKKAAQKGKHILCDKPVGVNANEVVEMLKAVKEANVEFMDGVMFMHHHRLQQLADRIHDKEKFGSVVTVTSGFHFYASDEWCATNIRLKKELEPLGAAGDLGWYTVRLSLFAFDYAWPVAAESRVHVSTVEGVPLEMSAALYFDNNEQKKAYFSVSFRQAFQQWAVISGTGAIVQLDDFVIPRSTKKVDYSVKVDTLNDNATEISQNLNTVGVEDCCQETEMMRTFSEAVIRRKSGGQGLDPFWQRVVLQTQTVLDACLASAATGKRIPITPLEV